MQADDGEGLALVVTRRAGLVLAAATLLGGPAGHAQSGWPERPVGLLVGFAPGSTTDVAEPLGAAKIGIKDRSL